MLRKAKNNELDKILQIINEGKQFLKEQGINQWQHGAPGINDIEKDIKQETSYVYELDGKIVGTAMLILMTQIMKNTLLFGRNAITI